MPARHKIKQLTKRSKDTSSSLDKFKEAELLVEDKIKIALDPNSWHNPFLP